jgi:hypothetical protein
MEKGGILVHFWSDQVFDEVGTNPDATCGFLQRQLLQWTTMKEKSDCKWKIDR